jgi:F0F1-type ATP synthase membrane subunit b/b'
LLLLSLKNDYEKTKKEKENFCKLKDQLEKSLKEANGKSSSIIMILEDQLEEAKQKIKELQFKVSGKTNL